ncbi:helix-turn-helix domain-containing protein [Bacillus shivajii]|uniref:CdaR family transcriptional regulator n=1 Tax=Bacillus shivajii TaxID=1983719 RepID=UPI001CFAE9D4|nr:sugar diacid recognition domain-containing protein [Bacillus shivajii]UCZ54440.1 helix-turn-helix domain-containing protein [Bacillus shivajii]
MKLLSTIAERIVDEVTQIVQEEVIVVDERGLIIAASDIERVSNFHEGAYKTLQQKEKFIITENDVHNLEGVKVGLNLPIILDGRPIGVIGITGKSDEVVQFGQLIQRMTELIIQESFSRERLESKYRGLETFIYEWVNVKQLDRDFLERGEILGISLNLPRVCVLFEVNPHKLNQAEGRIIEREMIDTIRGVFNEDDQNIIVPWGQGRFVLVNNEEGRGEEAFLANLFHCQNEIKKHYRLELFIGVGNVTKEPSELPKSYQQAKKALNASKKQHKMMFYDDLTLDVALAEITTDTKGEMVKRVLKPLMEDEELMLTLETYMKENMSLKSTADTLHIHINTLHYRLKRISEKTGLSLKKVENLVSFYLALTFYKEIR